MRIGYFTAGSIGAGHLARGVAIGRGLARQGFGGEYRMFGPALPFGSASTPNWEVVDIPVDRLRSAMTAPETELAARLRAFRPDLLIVDMFWAPLRFIPLPCPAWLIVRSFPECWFQGPPGVPFAMNQYERVIAIEPLAAARPSPRTDTVDPIVIANPDECEPRGALRRRLRMRPDEPLEVVTHAGIRGEVDRLAPLAKNRRLTFDLFAQNALFPAARWIGDADTIYAAGGYNTYWEAQWLGYATRTRFSPLRRPNDDQAARIATGGPRSMRANGADVLASWALGG